MNGFVDFVALARTAAGSRIVMLTSSDAQGRLRSCPLPLLDVDYDGALWFIVDRADRLCANLAASEQVGVISSRPWDGVYVAISGRAVIHADAALLRHLWRETYRAWFPGGLQDQRLAVMSVIPEEIRSWSGSAAEVATAAG